MSDLPPHPTFREAARFWLYLGLVSFGGPAGQIAIMHRELVSRRRWFAEAHFLHALNFCTLLPGPEAQQLATYLGWRLHGWRGGVVAGALFVLPAAVLLYGLAWVYVKGGEIRWIAGFFDGLIPAVIALVAGAVLRIGRKTLRTPALWVIAAVAFGGVLSGKVPFIWTVVGAGILGWLGHRAAPALFPAGKHGSAKDDASAVLALAPSPAASWKRSAVVVLVAGTLWWLPVLAAGLWLGWRSTIAQEGLFFSKAALVTIGGAYAVLPYVAQQAVHTYGWLTEAAMMKGLALAETTPGPLIIVLQFAGFVAGWNHPGTLEPWLAATLGAAITTWTTFLPSFLMVFLGAPHVEKLRENPVLAAALTAITAAVVGVIAHLCVWFFTNSTMPAGGGFRWSVCLAAVAALVAMERLKWNAIWVIAGYGVGGLILAVVV